LQRVRTVEPRQPYPPAADYQDTEPEPVDDERPFELGGDHVPTLAGISAQIETLAAHVLVVHQEVAMTRVEVGELRGLVLKDHAPRITAAEHKIRVPDGVKTVGKYAGFGAVVTLVQQLWPVVADLLAKR
jgi:hypothetical protein